MNTNDNNEDNNIDNNNVAFQARSQAPLRLLVLTKRETIRKDRGKDVD